MQLGFEDMPVRLFSCTPSRLTTWQDCPRRYRLTYLDRPTPAKGPPWAHNTVGAADLALARWWDLPVARRTASGARALVERGWPDHRGVADGFRDSDQAARWRGLAGDMVEGYVRTLDPADEPVGVERTVATKTASLALSGRVDRIDRRGDEVVVVDYKTGRSVLTTDDARGSLALALYAVAAERTLRSPCTKVELHHLPTGRVLAWEHTPETLQRHVGRAERIATEVVAATAGLADGGDPDALFPARTSALCGWCDLARSCPVGRAASAPKQPWAGLAEDRKPPEG